MANLTGAQRYQLAKIWAKRYKKDMKLDDYIKAVCKAKNITYIKYHNKDKRPDY